jgi:hypothetical protein
MDLRGAKSNVMSLIGTYRNPNCPRVALLDAWPFASFGVHKDHWRTEKVAAISLTSSHVLGTRFPTGVMPCPRALCPRLLICEIEPIFRFDFNPCYRRERTTTIRKYNDLQEAGGHLSPC